MGNKNNKYLIQGSMLAVSSIIVRFIGLLYRVPLQRIIGDDGYAVYGVAFDIYNLALILSSYGIPIAVSKLISEREKKKEYKNSYKVFQTALVLAITVGGIASLIVIVLANVFADFMRFPSAAIPLRILAPTIFVFSILGVLRGLFQGKNTMLPTAISQVLEQIVNAVVSVVAALQLMKAHSASQVIEAYGAAGGTTGTLFGAITALGFLIFIYLIYHPVIKKRMQKDTSEHEESYSHVLQVLIWTVVPIILSQTVYNVSGTIDSTMFGRIMQSKGFESNQYKSLYGIYTGKYRQLTNLPVAVASALGATIVPTLVAAFLERNTESIHEKISSAIKFNMLICIPAAAGLTALAKPIISLLFAGDADLSAQLLQLGSVAVILFSLSTLTNGVLQGINKMKIPVIHSAISLAIHVILLYILLAVFDLGVYGLVIGNVTFALVVCMLNWMSIAKYIHYKQEVLKTFLIPFISSVIMGISAFFIYQFVYKLLGSNLIGILIAIMAAVCIYSVLIVLLRAVTKEELLHMPKGNQIVKLLQKFHLL